MSAKFVEDYPIFIVLFNFCSNFIRFLQIEIRNFSWLSHQCYQFYVVAYRSRSNLPSRRMKVFLLVIKKRGLAIQVSMRKNFVGHCSFLCRNLDRTNLYYSALPPLNYPIDKSELLSVYRLYEETIFLATSRQSSSAFLFFMVKQIYV